MGMMRATEQKKGRQGKGVGSGVYRKTRLNPIDRSVHTRIGFEGCSGGNP